VADPTVTDDHVLPPGVPTCTWRTTVKAGLHLVQVLAFLLAQGSSGLWWALVDSEVLGVVTKCSTFLQILICIQTTQPFGVACLEWDIEDLIKEWVITS
jgi:hypothetical protein